MESLYLPLGIALIIAVAFVVLRVLGHRVTPADIQALREAIDEGVHLADQLHGKEEGDKHAINARKKSTATVHVMDIAGPIAKKARRKLGAQVLPRMIEAAVSKKKALVALGRLAGKVL